MPFDINQQNLFPKQNNHHYHRQMKLLTKTTLVAAVACAVAPAVFAGIKAPDYNPTNYIYRKASSSVFDDSRTRQADALSRRIYAADAADGKLKSSMEPAHTYGPASLMGDLDAPNGETWFYTGELTYDEIPPDYENGIWYTDMILREYDFTIYDNKMEVIGHIKDKMRYEDDEVRAPYIDLAPIVTQKFYNTDDYYEIVVGVSTNPGVGMVREHSFIYSLNKPGQQDAEGFDMPVSHTYSFVGDVLTVSNRLGEEQYIITTSAETYSNYQVGSDDEEYEGDPADSPFWQALMSQKMTINVYGNAVNDTDGPLLIGTKEIPLAKLQGDQMDAPIVLTKLYNGVPYVMFAQYKESFYNPYANWSEDMSMRASNSLIVELYTQPALGAQLELFQTTEIPFVMESNLDRLLAQYYSVGSMRFRDDIDLDPSHYNNNSGKAYLTVTKQNYFSGDDESYISSYYVYRNTGARYRTLFTDAHGTQALSDVPGFEPQQMFVSAGSGYEFHFVNLLSGREVYSTSNEYDMGEDEEPELLLANLDRVAVGDSYNYVFELRVPTVDENENDCIRAIWIDADGTFNHIDEVNMGANVLYAQLYLNSSVLHPGVYSSSDNMAYMCLIKRGLEDSAMQEELLVGEAKSQEFPEGKTLLTCTPCEYGVLSSVIPVLYQEQPVLWVVYNDSLADALTLEVFKLPLDQDQSGIENVTATTGSEQVIQFDGATVYANGSMISVYNVSGRQVAAGKDTVTVSALAAGVYVVKAGEKTLKIAIK